MGQRYLYGSKHTVCNSILILIKDASDKKLNMTLAFSGWNKL